MTKMRPVDLVASGLISRPEHLAVVEDTTSVTGSRGRVLKARVLDGFDVEILGDRGLDLGAVWFNGRPLSWTSPIRDAARLPSPSGRDWMTRFNGGLVTTCGLENIGPPTPTAGMHGGHSHQVAHEVRWLTEVTDDGPKIVVTGTIDSAELFGRRVYVYREITIAAPADAQPYVSVTDTVRNEGVLAVPTALLYHVNFGAPTVLPGTRILVESAGATAREPCPSVPSEQELPGPTSEMTEAVFAYSGVQVKDGFSTALLRTPGARRGEILALEWSDIDFDQATISITKAISMVKGVRTVDQTKNSKARVVPIDAQTVSGLRAHRLRQKQEKLSCSNWQESNLVFCRPDGVGLRPDFVYYQFQKLIRESGVRRIRLHDIRHTHATWLLDAGEHMYVVAERLGHTDPQTTARIYAHVTPKQRSATADVFANVRDGNG